VTKRKLATVVTAVSLLISAVGLSQNIGSGFFSNDYGVSLFSYQGSIGLFIATGNGCPPNGFYADAELIDSFAGLVSLAPIRKSEGGVTFQIPGIIWLLSLGLLCAWLFRTARRSEPDNQIKQAVESRGPDR